MNPKTGDFYKEGEIMNDETLAKTFQRIADGGEKMFYSGTLADDIIADLKEKGRLTLT